MGNWIEKDKRAMLAYLFNYYRSLSCLDCSNSVPILRLSWIYDKRAFRLIGV